MATKTHAKTNTPRTRRPARPSTARLLMHDLGNALGAARLRVALMRTADASNTSEQTRNLDALELLLDQACAVELALHNLLDDPPERVERAARSTRRRTH